MALPRTETGIQPSHLDLGIDLAFVYRSLQSEGADPQSPFYAAVSAACAVGGHSMGGGASFLAAASDPSVTALFSFAAAETDPSAIAAAGQIAAPALLFAGSHDCVTPPAQHQQPMYAALASDCRTYAELIGASHCQFAEYNFLCNLGESGCPSPTISRTQQHGLTLALLQPWLDHFLKGDLQAWSEFQALLFGHAGITYLQDCEASAVGELTGAAASETRAQGPRLELTTGGIGSSGATFALLMPASAEVSLTIYDVVGRPVRALADRRLDAGRHEYAWDGTGDNGWPAPTGSYYCRLDSHPTSAALHVLILR